MALSGFSPGGHGTRNSLFTGAPQFCPELLCCLSHQGGVYLLFPLTLSWSCHPPTMAEVASTTPLPSLWAPLPADPAGRRLLVGTRACGCTLRPCRSESFLSPTAICSSELGEGAGRQPGCSGQAGPRVFAAHKLRQGEQAGPSPAQLLDPSGRVCSVGWGPGHLGKRGEGRTEPKGLAACSAEGSDTGQLQGPREEGVTCPANDTSSFPRWSQVLGEGHAQPHQHVASLVPGPAWAAVCPCVHRPRPHGQRPTTALDISHVHMMEMSKPCTAGSPAPSMSRCSPLTSPVPTCLTD